MYSVFAKTLVEGKAANILREHLDPLDKMKFGDTQKIHANLCDFCKGGAMTRVSAAVLESRLTNVRLNETWTKTVSAFVTAVSHLIRDHKEATQGIHTDGYYIEKLNAMFFEHKDMAAHIQTMETQDAMLSRRLGTTIAPCTYEDHLHELSDYATLLDNRYSKAQANRRSANSSNVSNNSNNSNNGSNSGRGSGGRGRGRGDSGGSGNVDRLFCYIKNVLFSSH